jgi:hypothetical protein
LAVTAPAWRRPVRRRMSRVAEVLRPSIVVLHHGEFQSLYQAVDLF